MKDLIQAALEEDIGAGDVTTEALVPHDARARATIVGQGGLEPPTDGL